MATSPTADAAYSEKAAYEHGEQGLAPVETDGDFEAPAARGVEAENIPNEYWFSFRFLGSAASIILMAVSLYISFALPASALTVINADLGPSASYIWITDAGGVVTAVGLLIVGRVSDIVGRRYFLIAGQIFGIVGAALCAKATSINMLIVGGAINGIATTTQLTFPFVIQELVPNKYRGFAQAAMIVAVLPFAGFGSIIARQLIEYTSLGWRWCYLLNVISCAVSLMLLVFCYFPPTLHQLHSKLTWQKELMKLDYGGIVLFAASQVLILIAVNWGGTTYPWTAPPVLAPLVIGCVLIPVFGLYEAYMPLEQPLLPMKLLKNRSYVAILFVASVGQMVFIALSILWPEQITYLYTTDNIKIGWMSITSGLALGIGEIVMGPLLKVIGHARIQLIASTVLLVAFLGGLAGTNQNTQGMALAFTILAGFFSGWLDVITLVANGLVTDPSDLGLANGFLGSVKQSIGTIAISIYVAILEGRIAVNLPTGIADAAVGAGLPSSSVTAAIEAVSNGTAAALAAVPGMNATIEVAIADGVKSAWASSFSTVYLASLAFGGLGIIASFFTSDIDKHMTNYVSRRITGTVATEIPAEYTIKHADPGNDE